MEEVLDKKQKAKLKTINDQITTVLRDEVLKDTGHSRLKQTTLDLISKLRVEARILTVQKDILRENIMRKKNSGRKEDSEYREQDDFSDSSQEAPPEQIPPQTKAKT